MIRAYAYVTEVQLICRATQSTNRFTILLNNSIFFCQIKSFSLLHSQIPFRRAPVLYKLLISMRDSGTDGFKNYYIKPKIFMGEA